VRWERWQGGRQLLLLKVWPVRWIPAATRRRAAGEQGRIATCEANGVNPVDYVADVLLRLQSHPASRIDELLPHRSEPPPANTS